MTGGALDEAARLFELGARGGNRLAKFNLAMMLYREETTSNDHNAAWRWLRRAAQAGLPQAQYNFGLLYEHGDGVKRDYRLPTNGFAALPHRACATLR